MDTHLNYCYFKNSIRTEYHPLTFLYVILCPVNPDVQSALHGRHNGHLWRGAGRWCSAGVAFVRGHQGLPHSAHSGLQWTHYRWNTAESTEHIRGREKERIEGETKAWTPGWEEGKRHSRLRSRYFPAAHGEDDSRIDIHTVVHEGPHTGAGGCFLVELQPLESPH